MATLFDSLQPFSEVNFRDIYQKFIYIDCKELLNEMLPGELDDSITGMLVYCYIDRTEGIGFRPFMIAALGKESLRTYEFPHLEDSLYLAHTYSQELQLFLEQNIASGFYSEGTYKHMR